MKLSVPGGEQMGKFFDKTFIKFVIVGVINTIVGTAVMFLLYWVGAGYWFSSAANYIVGSIVSYFLNKYYTFKESKRSPWQVLWFAIHIGVCYYVSHAVAKPIGEMLLPGTSLEMQESAAMLIAMGLFVILNYLGQKYIIFPDKKKG